MNDAYYAWRAREGSALLTLYGTLIAAASAVFVVAPGRAHVFHGVSSHLWYVPLIMPLLLIAAITAVRPLRAYAYRLQLGSVAPFLLVLVAVYLSPRYQSGSLLVVVICMFAVQYAFLRWQELVATYGATLATFGALAWQHGTFMRASTLNAGGALVIVSALCTGLGTLRLRGMYAAARERARLERQTAELRRQTERNARMAYMDHLTGLLNRAGMNDLIDRALLLSRKNDTRTALLYIDLDGFKQINDICGHDAGDLALVEAALRIQYLLRFGESAGRIGGDEFVVVLPSVNSAEEAAGLARRLEEAFTEPFVTGKRAFRMSASIGIAVSCEDGHTRLELLSAADRAMYAVKRWRKIARTVQVAHGGGSGI